MRVNTFHNRHFLRGATDDRISGGEYSSRPWKIRECGERERGESPESSFAWAVFRPEVQSKFDSEQKERDEQKGKGLGQREKAESFSGVVALLAGRLLSGRKYTEPGTGGECTHRYQLCNLRVISRVV